MTDFHSATESIDVKSCLEPTVIAIIYGEHETMTPDCSHCKDKTTKNFKYNTDKLK
jgi:hypothetical protein